MRFNRFWDDDPDESDSDTVTDQRDENALDLTPMVDVTFLLLIFFMITASFALQGVFAMPPPEREGDAAAQAPVESESETETVVRIDAGNNVYVDDVPVTPRSRLPNVLRSKRSTILLIVSEEQAAHEAVVQVVDAAQDVGLQHIKIAIAPASR